MLKLQHVLSAEYAALTSCCESSTTYHIFSYGQSTFLQCYIVALFQFLLIGSVHAGYVHLCFIRFNKMIS